MIKRGQVAIIIAVAVVIISLVVVTVVVVNKNKNEDISKFDSDPKLQLLERQIINCAEDTIKESLVEISAKGGYYNAPENSLEMDASFIPYYYDKGELLIPPINKVENSLEQYINFNLPDCIDLIDADEFEIQTSITRSNVLIKDNEVLCEIDLPITIIKENERYKYELKEKEIKVDSAIKDLYETADYIAASHKLDPKYQCITCLADMADENDLYIDFFVLDDKTTIVVISENHSQDSPVSNMFMNMYTGEEKEAVIPAEFTDSIPGMPEDGGEE